jgi:hypothetical protein
MEHINIFIAVTAAAVALQAVLLLGILLSLRKTSTRVESLAEEVRGRALPVLESAQGLMATSGPKLDAILSNVETATNLVRGQVERLDATVTDVIDRTRLQVIRADELVTRTIDRVEEATETVQHTVVSPVRQISGLVQGVSVGLEALFRRRGRRRASGDGMSGVPQDEMFI